MKEINSGTSSGYSGSTSYRDHLTVGRDPSVEPFFAVSDGPDSGTCSHTYTSTIGGLRGRHLDRLPTTINTAPIKTVAHLTLQGADASRDAASRGPQGGAR